MAKYWPTQGFKGRTFKLCVLIRWDFNFCVRPRGLCWQVSSWFYTSCRPCLMFSRTEGFLAGAEPPGQRHLRWGWSHEGCSGLTVVAPSPVWTSDIALKLPTTQKRTLALDAQGLWSNVSGQQVGIFSGSCMQRRSLCWLLQTVNWMYFPQREVSVNSTPRHFALRLSQGFGRGGCSW